MFLSVLRHCKAMLRGSGYDINVYYSGCRYVFSGLIAWNYFIVELLGNGSENFVSKYSSGNFSSQTACSCICKLRLSNEHSLSYEIFTLKELSAHTFFKELFCVEN